MHYFNDSLPLKNNRLCVWDNGNKKFWKKHNRLKAKLMYMHWLRFLLKHSLLKGIEIAAGNIYAFVK